MFSHVYHKNSLIPRPSGVLLRVWERDTTRIVSFPDPLGVLLRVWERDTTRIVSFPDPLGVLLRVWERDTTRDRRGTILEALVHSPSWGTKASYEAPIVISGEELVNKASCEALHRLLPRNANNVH